ncbi:THUMP domain-containing protein 3 [Podila epigama]|nr:THUMP domain-containing protein 3 [Podila epigama]
MTENSSALQLVLSVPMGLEDVAVTLLPHGLIDIADEISYILGSGYLTVDFAHSGENNGSSLSTVLSSFVHHPPLCVFAASVTIGHIRVPRFIFDCPKEFLSYLQNGFCLAHNKDLEQTTDLQWDRALSVIRDTSLAVGSTPLTTHNNDLTSLSKDGQSVTRFRATFDRGTVQHKGVRSQDVAAALGGLTGRTFPDWRVNLKEYDVEVVGCWLSEKEPVYIKRTTGAKGREIHKRSIEEDPESVKRKKTEPCHTVESLEKTSPEQTSPEQGSSNQVPLGQEVQEKEGETRANDKEIKVGVTLPLRLEDCPYRFRPVDGRTSLRMEIAYTLLALAGPKPGDVVLDVCAGVGTIPIVGAAHFPQSLFVGSEIVPSNVEKAAENAVGMKARVERETRSGLPSHSKPILLFGDAKAVCWRSGTVDLIVSDLPWGQRESSHLANCKMYPRLVKEVVRLLRVGGRAILVTGERKLLQRQLDSVFAKPYLQVVSRREITIGFSVIAFELVRI